MRHSRKFLGALILGATVTTPAFATNGYAPHGIGMKSKGMGGIFIGYQGDSVALGGNPISHRPAAGSESVEGN